MGVETDAPVITAETEALNFTNEGGVEGTISPFEEYLWNVVAGTLPSELGRYELSGINNRSGFV